MKSNTSDWNDDTTVYVKKIGHSVFLEYLKKYHCRAPGPSILCSDTDGGPSQSLISWDILANYITSTVDHEMHLNCF